MMSRMQGVTATDTKSKQMAEYGRNGDTEMAHVTPGEIVIPESIQTPRVMQVLSMEFEEQGVPMERYIVQDNDDMEGPNSTNPETGNDEFFLSKVLDVGKKLVGGAVGGMLGGGDAGGGSAAAPAAAPGSMLPAPVQTLQYQQNNLARTALPRGNTLTNTTYTEVNPFVDTNQNIIVDPNRSRNPGTGMPEYYDTGRGRMYSVNSRTGKQQCYDTMKPRSPGGMNSTNPVSGYPEYFDSEAYYAANPDVKASGMSAEEHWKKYGQAEGRKFASPTGFNADSYYAANPDVKKAGMDAATHYGVYGKDEGRSYTAAPTGFNASTYASLNPDVARSGVDPTQHYLNQGQKEGRSYNMETPANFDAQRYADLNPWWSNSGYTSPLAHYNAVGKKSGALLDYNLPEGFDERVFNQNNPDVAISPTSAKAWYSRYGNDPSQKGRIYSTAQTGSDEGYSSDNGNAEGTTSTATSANQNAVGASQLSPVRTPRFRSRTIGSIAPNF